MQEWISNNADFLQGLTALGAIASFIFFVAARARAGVLAGVLDRVLGLVMIRRPISSKTDADVVPDIVGPVNKEKARASIGVMPFDNLSPDEKDI